MAKFAVGDKVRALQEASDQFTIGKIYEVDSVDEYSLGVIADDRGKANGWSFSCFELAEPATQTPQPSFIKTVPARREIAYSSMTTKDSRSNIVVRPINSRGVEVEIADQLMTAKDLREAATIFNQIADVLEENSNAS